MPVGGVLLDEVWDEHAQTHQGHPLSVDDELDRAFEACLLESSTLAFRVAYSVLRHRQDAEDVAQDVFAKAYRSFRQLRDPRRFRAWLVRMTWRMALDRRRADRRRAVRDTQQAAGHPPLPTESPYTGRLADIWHAIDTLPDKLRVVVVLANVEGHDIAEVAALLDLPAGTVKSRLFSPESD